MFRLICFFVFLLNFIYSFSQSKLNLKECLKIGIENNYKIHIEENNKEIQENNNTWGNTGFLPTIDLSAGYDGTLKNIEKKSADNTTTKYTNANDNTFDVGINTEWTIFDGFRIQAKHKKLKELENNGALNFRMAIENLMSDILVAYFNHIYQLQKLSYVEASVNISKERVRIVEARYQIGTMSHLNLKQAMVDLNSDRSKYISQIEAVTNSYITLNKLLAIEPINNKFSLADTSIQFLDNLDFNELQDETMQHNTELLIANSNKTITEQELKILNADYYPYLKLNGGYGYEKSLTESSSTKETKKLGFDYGFSIGMNIFDGMNTKRECKNAKLEIENAKLRESDFRLELSALLSSLYLSYLTNNELKEMEHENLIIAHEYYETAIDKYKLGSLSGLELREAQVSLLEAEERMILAEYNLKLCEISLKKISGNISDYLK